MRAMRTAYFALACAALTLPACSTRAPATLEPTPTPTLRAAAAPLPALWTLVDTSLSSPRANHDAALLAEGRVLICGGRNGGATTEYLASCDVFDAAAGTIAPTTTALPAAAAFLTVTAGDAGRVYALGGENPKLNPTYRDAVSLFYAASNGPLRSEQQKLRSARSHHTTSWLPAVRALVAVGGFDGALVAEDELGRADESGAITTFVTVGPASKRIYHSATVLSSGNQLLVVGGGDPTRADYISSSVRLLTVPASGSATWSELSPLSGAGLAEHSATLLPDGRVLIAGGRPAAAYITDETAIYDPRDGGTMTEVAAMATRRTAHAAVSLHGKIIVIGGETPNGVSRSVEVYDPERDVWSPLGPLNVARRNHVVTLLDDRRALVSGGIGADTRALDSAEILAPRLQGEPCLADAQQCLSGYCVDGYCCDRACDGACERCDQSGALGVCQSDVSGLPVGNRDCPGGLVCNDGACLERCQLNEQCRDELYCSDGQCVARKPLKSTCTEARECAGGAPCVDGYCCDSACDGICEACGEPASEGKCVPVSGEPRGARPSCGEPAGECGLTCDGERRDACSYAAAGSGCGEDRCVDGRATTVSECDGFGNCGSVPQDCKGAFACRADGRACRSDCESEEDCAGNAYTCSLETQPGVCVFKADVGKACKADRDCGGGLVCEDSVCCAEHCSDAGSSCATPNHLGVCRKELGEACESPSDCGSDHCVLGVCCDSECSGQCETCAAEGHVGQCRPQRGDPEPRRPPCAGGDDFCQALTCSGLDEPADRESCTALRNVGESCEAARCDANVFVPERRCAAHGGCAESTPQPCSLQACTSDGCTEGCSSDADCASDARCREGACVPAGPYCKGNTLLLADGSSQDCGGYRCTAGHCPSACQSSEQCADDFVCDDASGTCTALRGSSDSGCGCSVPGNRSRSAAPLSLLLGVLAALTRRQRRSSVVSALISR